MAANERTRSYMRVGLVLAAAIIVIRIVLEQVGVSDKINNAFGVAWLYFVFPVLFALGIRADGEASPYKALLKSVTLYALYTRLMVMVTYMLAYFLQWRAPRFGASMGGNVGDNIGLLEGLLWIPIRNAVIWVLFAIVLGMALGSLVLLLTRRKKGSNL